MRIRHKIPAIFTISIVDMLCCSLGCVILLWLLGAKQADSASKDSKSLLSESKLERGKLSARMRALLDDLEKAAGLRARLESEIGDLSNSRESLRTRLTDLEAKLKASSSRLATRGTDLAKAESKLDTMKIDLDRARARLRAEEMRAASLEKTISKSKVDLAAISGSLADAKAARLALEKVLSQRDKELASAEGYKDRLEASEARERLLVKQVKDRQAALSLAKTTLARLEKEKLHLREAADNRFAGITLTGKRVVFLVDMSGSMELVDENTPAPEKWVEVRNTVARIMRSLPELEKYQVITFSSKSDFPLGSPGKWLEHDPKTSPALVLRTLAGITPKGGTNMYAALESAFRLRAGGLDTIYLLSDGLPNMGEGLTPAKARVMKELERGAILGKYVRTTLKTNWNKPRPSRPRVRINAIGFFYESPDLGAFLWALARENDGSFVGMSKP